MELFFLFLSFFVSFLPGTPEIEAACQAASQLCNDVPQEQNLERKRKHVHLRMREAPAAAPHLTCRAVQGRKKKTGDEILTA